MCYCEAHTWKGLQGFEKPERYPHVCGYLSGFHLRRAG